MRDEVAGRPIEQVELNDVEREQVRDSFKGTFDESG